MFLMWLIKTNFKREERKMDVNVSIPEVAIANIKYGEIVAGAKELN